MRYFLGRIRLSWVTDMPVQNAEIAAMFDQAAELLEIGGENQFRVRAYRRAARVIEGLPKAVGSLLKSGRDLSELPGIGKDLAGKIADIVKTGHFGLLDTLKRKLPAIWRLFRASGRNASSCSMTS